MRVLISAVGQRTEHWTDLFTELAREPALDVTVVVADVSPLTIEGLERARDLSPGLRFHHLPHVLSEARSGHMASIVAQPRSLRALDIQRPDVIHIIGEAAYLSTGQLIGLRDRRWPGVPITHYAAQNVVTRFPLPFPWLERRAYRAVDHMFPITPAAMEVLRRKGYDGPASIVPLGVDTGQFVPAPRQGDGPGFTIGFVGRLEAHKGVGELLEAAERVDGDALVVGQGQQAEQVREASRRRPGRVVLHDWVDHEQLPGLLAQMDVLVLPSTEIIQRNVLPWVRVPLREQFGRVLVEAMACGIPVVGSDVGEIPHVIGDAGLVFPAGDVDALTEQLTRLRDDPTWARDLGRLGVERAGREFSWQRVATRMRGIWNDLATADEEMVITE